MKEIKKCEREKITANFQMVVVKALPDTHSCLHMLQYPLHTHAHTLALLLHYNVVYTMCMRLHLHH